MAEDEASSTALILAGAAANGAFEAGAIQVLLEAGVRFGRIVAASSGGLNGTLLASAIRAGTEAAAAPRLPDIWEHDGGWLSAIRFSPMDLLRRRGLSDQEELRKLLRKHVQPVAGPDRRPVDLRFVVTAIQGAAGNIGTQRATTFEKVLSFRDESFDRSESLEDVFTAAVASAAFPALFCPVEVEGVGPCTDGGAVNNTPIRYALEGTGVSRIYVVVPYPQVMTVPASLSGLELAAHFAEMIVHERLYRDMHEAEDINETLRGLNALVERGVLTPEQLAEVLRVLPWKEGRRVQIVSVRPSVHLEGNVFSGFFSANVRRQLISQGREAAHRAIEALRSPNLRPRTYL